ncbi:uncharacterized protein Z520_10818 [Fonsecaea multimorphosa CBS 102226]|uniref:Aromatic amino acid beta-eliminating lyase/threonine aldolase domain-containing protein n=1 Tax=Fonsecaea multimorphosa CBS 102226 TaxID=1442371 RepID=A0A0D2JSK3_9EURO|nr:uncharacterized protein Z520_10818 [Fonsecaea multimorphosa CBS 102226]KIX93399.1 hypothetical protein Z520_10818 [Fonsecaea multimorphosa CBS 102226]
MATNGVNGVHGDAHAPAEFDLRSDIVTVPTLAMLNAVANTTYKDDVYREDPTTEDFQSEMAKLLGHEDAIFMLSGTMSNQLGLRALLMQPPYSVLCDSHGHILHYEAGGVASLSGASIQPVEARNKKYLTLEDIKEKAILDDYVQYSPTRVISLENTLNGLVYPLEEIRRISAFARENKIKMHLDGARLWDAVVAGGGTLKDYAQEFDTVNLCFSKGLGAPLGSILVGSNKTIAQARKVRQSIGGGMHQAGVLTAMARVAFRDTFGGRVDGKGSLLLGAHQKAKHLAQVWVGHGGKLLGPTETCMVFLNFKDIGLSRPELEKMALEYGLIIKNERLVVHYRKTSKRIVSPK